MENKDEKQIHESNAPNNETSKSSGKGAGNFVIWAIVILVVATVATFGIIRWGAQETGDDQVLATINGVEITMSDISSDLDQVKTQYMAQGIDITQDKEMESMMIMQIVQNRIHQEILMDHAEKLGLDITEGEVEEEYQILADQFGGTVGLEGALQDAGMTEMELRSDIQRSLLIRLLAEREGGLEVTEEEIQNYYDQLQAQIGDDLPPLEEIRDQLEQELKNEKLSFALEAILTEIEDDYDVQILIDMPEQPMMPPMEMEAEPHEEDVDAEGVILEE